MKNSKKVISVFIALLVAISSLSCFAYASNGDYRIVSPYEDIIWEGENAHTAY